MHEITLEQAFFLTILCTVLLIGASLWVNDR